LLPSVGGLAQAALSRESSRPAPHPAPAPQCLSIGGRGSRAARVPDWGEDSAPTRQKPASAQSGPATLRSAPFLHAVQSTGCGKPSRTVPQGRVAPAPTTAPTVPTRQIRRLPTERQQQPRPPSTATSSLTPSHAHNPTPAALRQSHRLQGAAAAAPRPSLGGMISCSTCGRRSSERSTAAS
jgi:hypothetical protein